MECFVRALEKEPAGREGNGEVLSKALKSLQE